MLFLCLLFLCLASCTPQISEESSAARPNVVFILSDDHGTQMMSAYGSERASTPNLDRIAEGGLLFRNGFCTNALCAPSRAVILTGKYSHLNGQRFNSDSFDGGQATFPKLMHEAGYQTALVGKWHLRSAPTGFDYSSVLRGHGEYIDPTFVEQGQPRIMKGYVTDLICDLALAWLRERDPSKPFLLLYHHKAPHAPWIPAARHRELYRDERLALPESFADRRQGRAESVKLATNRLIPELLRRWRGWGAMQGKRSPAGLAGAELEHWIYQEFVRDYLRVLASLDENVGRLLDFLDRAGLSENTLVIYSSDNGAFVGDHFMYDKRLMYDEAMRVPLVMRLPGSIAAGTESSAFALNLDFAPTLLDYAGVPAPVQMQGRSLRPILEGREPADWRRSVYYQYLDPPESHRVVPHYGIRTEKFKLIRHAGEVYGRDQEWELIDLLQDPLELENVISDPAYAQHLQELRAELQDWRKRLLVPQE